MGPVHETTLAGNTTPAEKSLHDFARRATVIMGQLERQTSKNGGPFASMASNIKNVSRLSTLAMGGGALAGVTIALRTAGRAMEEYAKTSEWAAFRVEQSWGSMGAGLPGAIRRSMGEFMTDMDDVLQKATGTAMSDEDRASLFYSQQMEKPRRDAAILIAEQRQRATDMEAQATMGPTAYKLYELEREKKDRFSKFPAGVDGAATYSALLKQEFEARSSKILQDSKVSGGIYEKFKKQKEEIEKKAQQTINAIEAGDKRWGRYGAAGVLMTRDSDIADAEARYRQELANALSNEGDGTGAKVRGGTVGYGLGGIRGITNSAYGNGAQDRRTSDNIAQIKDITANIAKALNSVGTLK